VTLRNAGLARQSRRGKHSGSEFMARLARRTALVRIGRWVLVALALCAAAAGAKPASELSAAPRAPDVPYEPTPSNVVAQMLQFAQVRADDVVYDLGCGDGRIVIAAVKEKGARGVCVDIDPQRIREARANAAAAGVLDRIRFLEQDLFAADIAGATVVVLFLWPEVNLKLRPKLWRELRRGTRVISYVHSMGDWEPQQSMSVQGRIGVRNLHLWTIAAPRGM
jgi:SAM-dependent methyltransferase